MGKQKLPTEPFSAIPKRSWKVESGDDLKELPNVLSKRRLKENSP